MMIETNANSSSRVQVQQRSNAETREFEYQTFLCITNWTDGMAMDYLDAREKKEARSWKLRGNAFSTNYA